MKIQRVIAAMAFGALMLLTAPVAVAGEPRKVVVDQAELAKLPPADQERVLYIAERLEAITNMDRSGLTREERRALRTETRGLKAEADAYNAGGTVIYLSTAGIIIILLLLIILL